MQQRTPDHRRHGRRPPRAAPTCSRPGGRRPPATCRPTIQVRDGISGRRARRRRRSTGRGFALVFNGSSWSARYVPALDHARRHRRSTTTAPTRRPAGSRAPGRPPARSRPAPNGTVTIDVPAVAAGTLLVGARSCSPTTASTPACRRGSTTRPAARRRPTRPSAPTTSSAPATPRRRRRAVTTTSVQLSAPRSRSPGRKTVTVTGKVLPARAGVPVTITRTATRSDDDHVTSAADGSFCRADRDRRDERPARRRRGHRLPRADGHRASTVKIKVRTTRTARPPVTGTVDPKLPGPGPVAAHQRRQPSARTTTPQQRHVPPASSSSRSRPLPGRLHPERRARRAGHLQHWSHPMKLSRSLPLGVLAALAVPGRRVRAPGRLHVPAVRAARPADACTIPDGACLRQPAQTYAVANDGCARASPRAPRPRRPARLGDQRRAGRARHDQLPLPAGLLARRGQRRPAARVVAHGRADRPAGARHLHRTRAWDTTANILAWQEDPFFNYIPWQKTSVGIGDEPAKWIAGRQERHRRRPPGADHARPSSRPRRAPTPAALLPGRHGREHHRRARDARSRPRCRARSRRCRPA